MRKAIVIGAQGQDGRLMEARLEGLGYQVTGVSRPRAEADLDICSAPDVNGLMESVQPDEVYHFAACHHSSEQRIDEGQSFYQESLNINLVSLINFLDAARVKSPRSKIFYAASSRIFGEPVDDPVTETTPLAPVCPYGIAKSAGLEYCRYFRRQYGLFVSVGILFNHESSLRPTHYLSKRIVQGVLSIVRGESDRLVLGALKAGADWSYAPDMMEQIHGTLQLPEAGDYVLASGEWHRVEDFARLAFGAVGLDWTKYVAQDGGMLREVRKPFAGDPAKFRAASGWTPKRSFEEMIRQLIIDEGGENLLK